MFTRKLLQGVFGLAAGAVVAGGIGFSGAAHASPVYDTSVGMDNLTGTRVLDAEELETDGATVLTTLTLDWEIFQYDAGPSLGLWSYSYSLAWTPTSGNAISHMILDLSASCILGSACVQNARIGDDANSNGIEKITYGTFASTDPGNANPGMGAAIQGIKFDVLDGFGGTPFTIKFDSDRAPVWGDFYTKAGNPDGVSGWYSQNVGIGDLASTNIFNFIARPDTVGEMPPGGPGGPGIDVPEPMSMAVLGIGLIGLAAARRRRNSLS